MGIFKDSMDIENSIVAPYIKDSIIEISWNDLDRLFRQYGVDKVTYDISMNIKDGRIAYPLKQYFMYSPASLIDNKTQAKFELRSYIQDMLKASPFLKDETRGYQGKEIALVFYESDYERLDIISDYFTENVRIGCNVRGKLSPRVEYKKSSGRVVNAAIDKALKYKHGLNTKSLSDAIYDVGMKMCTTFKISVAMAIFDAFRPQSVLVPFEGWSDKMIAAYLSETVTTYVSTDPNKELQGPYQNVVDYMSRYRPKMTAHVYDRPIEDLDLTAIYGPPGALSNPDLVFGSPPYSTYEVYGKDPEQSISKFPKYQEWLDKWFLPVIVKLWAYVKPGGHLIYHMGYIPDTPIIEPFVNLVKTFQDGMFLGQIPLINANKPARRPVFLYVVRKN